MGYTSLTVKLTLGCEPREKEVEKGRLYLYNLDMIWRDLPITIWQTARATVIQHPHDAQALRCAATPLIITLKSKP